MHTIRWVTLGFGLLATFGTACGGKDTSPRAGVDTGLPPEKKLSDLTDAEVRQACESFAQSFMAEFTPQKMTTLVCTAVALTSSQTPATCQTATSQCIANPPTGVDPTISPPDCSTASAAGFADCSVTVSELETCLSDDLAAFQTYMARINCSIAGNTQAIQDLGNNQLTQPASCTAIETKCPGTVTSGGSTTGAGGGAGAGG